MGLTSVDAKYQFSASRGLNVAPDVICYLKLYYPLNLNCAKGQAKGAPLFIYLFIYCFFFFCGRAFHT